MINLNLQSDEAILLQSVGVCPGGFMSSYTDELYLTNYNIIHVSKNMFGKVKRIDKYQLSQIKLFNDLPQVNIGKNSNGINELQIYFKMDQKSFTFQSGKREISKWIKAINQTMNSDSEQTLSNKHIMAIPGTEQVAETIKDTVGKFKSSLGIKTKMEYVTSKCAGCSATLSGEKGKQVCCEYCGTFQSL